MNDPKPRGYKRRLPAEAKPSKEETEEIHEMIDALSAVEDMEHAHKLEKVRELEKIVGMQSEGNKTSFTEREDSRGKPSDFERGQ